MNILFITPIDPNVGDYGGQQRSATFYRALEKLGTVYMLIPNEKLDRECMDLEHRIQWINPFLPPHRRKRQIRSFLRLYFGHEAKGAFWEKEVRERVFPGIHFDCVVVRYVRAAIQMCAWEYGPCYLDVDDLPIEQYETEAAAYQKPLQRAWKRAVLRRWMMSLQRLCAGIWVTNERHRVFFPVGPVACLPNIARPVPKDYPYDAPRAQRLFTVGLLAYQPNYKGVDRFLAEVWPAVHAAYPALTYRIAGAGAPEDYVTRWSAIPGVEVVGFVDDLHAEYAQALACVAPIDSGSGTCIKTIEALLHGRCCLATPFAARGWPNDCLDGTNGLAVYRTADEFVELLDNLVMNESARKQREETGHHYASKHFGFEGFCETVRLTLSKNINA